MSIFKYLKEMDQRFSWSFMGFMLGIIGGSAALYNFYKGDIPDLNYIITANSSVLDIKEKLGSLDVLYRGESLSKNRKELRLITFTVINHGSASILSNFYDPNDPVGFLIRDGHIADDPVLIGASNNYLQKKLVLNKQSDSSISFSNVIMEPGEFFKIKILVLHEASKIPTIEPFGKVAQVNKIDLVVDDSSGEKRDLIEEVFSGGLYLNIVRFVVIGGVLCYSIFLLIFINEMVANTTEKRRKTRLIKIFQEYDSDNISNRDNVFFHYYLIQGIYTLKRIHELLINKAGLNELATEGPEIKRYSLKGLFPLFRKLRDEGVIVIEDDSIAVEKSRLAVLKSFISFLERKGELSHGPRIYAENDEVGIMSDEHNE